MESEKKPLGRPTVKKEKKKSSQIFVNLTEEQKNKLVELSEKQDVSLSWLCLDALKKAKYI